MTTMLLKACPKCGGDCQWDDDEKEYYCIQAGHRFSLDQMKEIVEAANKKKREREAPPAPPAPKLHGRRGGRKNPLTEYYEQNKEPIIADTKTLGETATRKKWGIKSGMWTTLKKRWGLPINKRGYRQGQRSVLPPPAAIESSMPMETKNPEATAQAIAEAIMGGARPLPSLAGCKVMMISINRKNGLPPLPEWNDGWPEEVKLRWLSIYEGLVRC